MDLYEAMQKTSPVPYKKRKENESNFKKMVDRNTELVDELKELKRERDDLAEAYNKLSEYYQDLLKRKRELKARIDRAIEKSIDLQKRYGYILDDLTYLLMQGSDKE